MDHANFAHLPFPDSSQMVEAIRPMRGVRFNFGGRRIEAAQYRLADAALIPPIAGEQRVADDEGIWIIRPCRLAC